MQQKYIDLLDRLEGHFNEIDVPTEEDDMQYDIIYNMASKNSKTIEDLEKDVATLKKEAHPTIFKTSYYRELLKRIDKLEKKCKCK